MKSLLNIFFLITSIISCIKILSTKSVASALIPFLMVISIGLILDLIEEIKRYRNDLVTNSSKTKIYKNKKFNNIRWSDIKIGNLIKVKKNEIIPADLFVICTSNKDFSFYLQTSNIDGETSLKKREVLIDTQKIFFKRKNKEENYLENIFNNYNTLDEENCYIKVDPPNRNIYKIDGTFILNDNNIFFNKNNTAIRGAILKNTDFIYGIVIYTGNDTKIMQNFIKPKLKYSYLDKLIDDIIIVIIVVRIIYVLIATLIGILLRYKHMPNYEKNKLGYEYIFYYRHNKETNYKNNSLENLKYFTSHFILSQNLLPTSVAVLLAVTKVIQSVFLENLEKSLRKKPNQKMKCFSSELLSELGSVKYIFCDKTGTLTKNQTQFKACSIFTSLFDENSGKSQTQNDTSIYYNYSKSKSSLPSYFNNLLERLKLRNFPLDVKNIENCPFSSQGEAMEEFVLNMALNHDIVIDIDKKGNNHEIKYQGTNPDEITLVEAARELGYFICEKVRNLITVKRLIYPLGEKEENFEIKKYKELFKVPFRSERKSSTIIVKDLKTNKIKLYIRGSDTKIFEKINSYSQDSILEITKEHIDNFARRGLRTLCYAFKEIPENDYKNWMDRYNEERQKFGEDKEKKENELIEEIENNCYLLGATALEDEMQDNVKKDIQAFIDAGINFWMLTGDKMETAESIGYGIKLFDADTEVYKIKIKEKEKVKKVILEVKEDKEEKERRKQQQVIERMEEIKTKIKEVQSDLSKITIGEGHIIKENKMDFNTKFNSLKKIIKNNIKVIYEENEDEEDKLRNINYNENNNEKDLHIRLKSKNKFFENGSERISTNDKFNKIYNNNNKSSTNVNESLNNINKILINFKREEIDTDQKDVENMSILKFMIDNKYFENSDVDFENFTIIKNKVEHPNLVYSFDSEKDKNYINGGNKTDIIINFNRDNSSKALNSRYFEKNTQIEKSIESSKIESEKNIVKKEQRKKTNLPIKEKDFLDYFNVCISKLREIFYIQQKSIFLFKIPYLYGLINEEKDPLTEDMKKANWKEKLNLKNYLMKTKIKYSLIITGECIKYCISEQASDLFWFLIQHSRSIICCGCTPIEKAEIVRFVKKHTKETTLAIGDGENDVNMIKEANVGIGIFGKEGSQAAFNSDYAFSEFQYLKQLLFINGRFTLLRNTYFLNMFFFKNFIYTFQGIINTFNALVSGNFFYDEFFDSMFNTFVSILPLITFSVIDEDFNPDFHHKADLKKKMDVLLPEMYKQTRDSKPFNVVKYIIISIFALILALIVSLIFNNSFSGMIKNGKGDISSIYELCYFTYLSMIIIHFFMIYTDSSLINYIIIIIFIIQVVVDIAFIAVMNTVKNDNKLSAGIISELMSSNINYLILIISCSYICLPFYILRRIEFYFGINIANLIKTKNINGIFEGKYYKTKIAQMIRALGAINKFKRIKKELSYNDNAKYDNINDINMTKAVKQFNEIEKDKIRK